MFRFFVLAVCFSNCIFAQIPINYTVLTSCNSNLINCASNNSTYNSQANGTNYCVQDYTNCIQSAQNSYRRPQSCYLARAAKIGLLWTFGTTMIIAGTTIVVGPILMGLLPFIANKIPCCREQGLHTVLTGVDTKASNSPTDTATPNPLDPLNEPGKVIMKGMVVSIGMVFGGIINFATFTSLYSSWSAWTTADANCRFDSYNPISMVGNLNNDNE